MELKEYTSASSDRNSDVSKRSEKGSCADKDQKMLALKPASAPDYG